MRRTKEDIAFMQGYVMACSCITSNRGQMLEVEEALREFGKIDWTNIDEHDRRILASTRKALRERAKRLK